jgi:S-adenosylmethionine:tRNA ribosyltransferase-isomerase
MAEVAVTLHTSDFDYHLPPELIAQTPPAVRGESRLLAVRRKGAKAQSRGQELSFAPLRPSAFAPFEHRAFTELPDLIPSGDLLVLNTTRVRHARLLGRRPSGAPAEILLLHPAGDDTWVAMGKPGSALRLGRVVELGSGMAVETVEELEQGYRRVRFLGGSAEAAMAALGRLPVPPYIHRDPTPVEDVRYHTVFAER